MQEHELITARAVSHDVAMGVALDIWLVGGSDASVATIRDAMVLTLVKPLVASTTTLEGLPGSGLLSRLLIQATTGGGRQLIHNVCL